MHEKEQPQPADDTGDRPLAPDHLNAVPQQEAPIVSLRKLRTTVLRRDGRKWRKAPSPTKPVTSIIVCNKCNTVLEIEFTERPTIDDLAAAKGETLENHHCRATVPLGRRGAGA